MEEERKLIESRIEQLKISLNTYQKTNIQMCEGITVLNKEIQLLNNILDLIDDEEDDE